ncbi:methionyl-tRNA formyltransferase [Marihabitans asiaticum]|uniref:Methionyl-tRNA formyltransferase n=1 Tax=Marihabitans asiaticum TaxID=415218 RepID=A0A560WAQ0_9MICO|nr:methionyl-tRNA formyltransferase [Marihabitans asiaticum]TWD14707.1 methionyl-tRNA formyltransferase [Marihabitans asiaticum]
MRLLFAGSPQAAVPSLRALAASAHEVVAVLTRPDAPVGRGRRREPTPVRRVAEELGIEVITDRPRDDGFAERLAALDLDCCPVVAYGEILPAEVLAIPEHGWVNLHFSLLPAWRGAAPVQRAIIAGDEVTGASTFVIEQGLDTGPVLGSMTETIRDRDTSGELLERLAEGGAELLVATMDGLAASRLEARPQAVDGVSTAPKLQPADARIDWTRRRSAIDRLVRGCTPAPGAWTTFRGHRLRIGPVTCADTGADTGVSLRPGEIHPGKREVLVGTADQPVRLGQVTPVGKKAMDAADWARGVRIEPGERLGEDEVS